MTIKIRHQHNFAELVRAISQGDVGLVECRDATTNEPVAVICIFQRDENNRSITSLPVAKMFESNPYEQLIPPAVSSDGVH